MHGRLFTFGCSFTRYKWPTWADALSPQFDQYYNFGKGGGGNSFILWSLAECDARHAIKSDDTVIIMWTSRDREDRHSDGVWQTPGATIVDTYGSLIRDCANIHAAKLILEGIGCDYYFLSMIDLNTFDSEQEIQLFHDPTQTYATTLEIVRPSVHNIIYEGSWHNAAFDDDYHPTPQQHIDYLDYVLPELEVDDKTRFEFAEVEEKVRNGTWIQDQHWYDGYCVDRY